MRPLNGVFSAKDHQIFLSALFLRGGVGLSRVVALEGRSIFDTPATPGLYNSMWFVNMRRQVCWLCFCLVPPFNLLIPILFKYTTSVNATVTRMQ